MPCVKSKWFLLEGFSFLIEEWRDNSIDFHLIYIRIPRSYILIKLLSIPPFLPGLAQPDKMHSQEYLHVGI